MNTNKKAYIVLPLLALLANASSCTVFNSVKDKLTGKNVTKEAVLPQDREQILKDKEAKTYTPEELAKGIVKGDWVIETVYGKEAKGEETPYLKFVPTENRVYGNNGCNVLNASYAYQPSDSTISFSNVLTTMKMCSATGITDYEINSALDAAHRYTWELKDSQYHLNLYDNSGKRIMELMHQNFDFLNGTWRVVAIAGEAVNVPDMKLVIDVDEGRVHGNTGCNILNGSLSTDMETPNSISFYSVGTTRRACSDHNYETPLVVSLEDAVAARPISKDKVLLLDSNGNVALELVRETTYTR